MLFFIFFIIFNYNKKDSIKLSFQSEDKLVLYVLER